MSEIDHPIHQQFSGEELRAIVEETARAERVVAAHCHGKPGIMAALRAGCQTIEHGSYLDEERRVPRYWSITTTGASPLASKVCKQRKRGACRWMYTRYETGEVELYDLSGGVCHEWRPKKSGDPCMLRNVL